MFLRLIIVLILCPLAIANAERVTCDQSFVIIGDGNSSGNSDVLWVKPITFNFSKENPYIKEGNKTIDLVYIDGRKRKTITNKKGTVVFTLDKGDTIKKNSVMMVDLKANKGRRLAIVRVYTHCK